MLKGHVIPRKEYYIYIYIPANVLLVNIEGHTYIEKDSQILICQINFIN